MSTKVLMVLGLVCILVSAYFYASNDAKLTQPNLKPSDIDYQATAVKALQTNEQGQVDYQLTADKVTHYLNAKTAVMQNAQILWRPQADRAVTLVAKNAQLDEVKQIVTLKDDVVMTSETTSSPAPKITLKGQDFIGNLSTNMVTSDQPVSVVQGQNSFESQQLTANMATGDYQFNRVSMTFMPTCSN
ncbi:MULTISPECIES: LPS export ABC transporter periplasmic protein LptC [unclassified Moraxella]|uniref:LPS export ABC transporter periplasmic protein LptC n=1 Tax=unclassified Moraxella TaxID=2685852 RepID=UPI003AF5716E